MSTRKPIEELILHEYYSRWVNAPGKIARGDVVREFCAIAGMKEGAIRKRFREIKNGRDRLHVAGYTAAPVIKKKQDEFEQLRIDMVNIGAVKFGLHGGRKGYPMSWKRAIEIAEIQGLVPAKKYSRQVVEYWAKRIGISNAAMNDTQVATQLVAKYANQAWLLDSTPSNQYYFNFEKDYIRYYPDLAKDKHLDDKLRKENLRKVWTYMMRDLFSGAYIILPFAPDGGGENLRDYLQFAIHCMTPKQDPRIPMHGRPDILISDKGSSLTSGLWFSFWSRLGTNYDDTTDVRSHKAKNPRAKGAVESQIGAFKRSYEAPLQREFIHSMDELIHFYTEWMIYDNNEHGYYQKWLESAWRHPVKRVTEKNIRDAYYTEEQRVVSAYRTVSINKEEWFTSSELHEGEKVVIFTDASGGKSCQRANGQVFPMRKIGAIRRDVQTFQILDDRGDELRKSDQERTREEMFEVAKLIRKGFTRETFLPPSNPALPVIKPASTSIETHSDMPESLPDVDAFWQWIERSVGVGKDDLGQYGVDIDYAAVQVFSSTGSLPGDFLRRIRNHVITSLSDSGGEIAKGG